MTSTSTHRNSTSRRMLSTWTKAGRPTRSSRWKPTKIRRHLPLRHPQQRSTVCHRQRRFVAFSTSNRYSLPGNSFPPFLLHAIATTVVASGYNVYANRVSSGHPISFNGVSTFCAQERGRKKEGRKAIRLRWQFTGERERRNRNPLHFPVLFFFLYNF